MKTLERLFAEKLLKIKRLNYNRLTRSLGHPDGSLRFIVITAKPFLILLSVIS